jgi:hypothetical protein
MQFFDMMKMASFQTQEKNSRVDIKNPNSNLGPKKSLVYSLF